MMSLPEHLDIEALLAPIPGPNPAGVDLRQDFTPQSPYYRMRDLRTEARDTERKLEALDGREKLSSALSQWVSLRELAEWALVHRTKDLEAATWCVEALVRSDGLLGFVAGCRLIIGLVEGFWDDIYPLPDDEGIAPRLAPIAGLNGLDREGSLLQPLRKLPLFTRPDKSPLRLWQYEKSAQTETIDDPERRDRSFATGAIPFATVEKEAHAASAEMAIVGEMAQEAGAWWRKLHGALEARAGAETPPSSRVAEVLDRIVDITQKYAVPDPAPSAETHSALLIQAPPLRSAIRATIPQTGGFASREAALDILDELAAYFRRSEPNSPLAYTLQEAARRGR